MIHLDTNYLIRALVPGTSQAVQVRAWIDSGESLGISAMAWAEFLCGPVSLAQSTTAALVVGIAEPITAADAVRSANLFNASGRRRGTLADCLIAAVALRVGASLATENHSDFTAFSGDGLQLVP